jgi:hypothetical protein
MSIARQIEQRLPLCDGGFQRGHLIDLASRDVENNWARIYILHSSERHIHVTLHLFRLLLHLEYGIYFLRQV